jgi:hypothetical protein
MELTTIEHDRKEMQARRMFDQLRWQRITLLAVLGYEAAGAVLGGILLVAAPDGRYMDMPVGIMHGVFRDFLIPGIILIGLGILNAAAFVAAFRKSRADWVMAGLALGGLAIWFAVEIAILQELHWLHLMWGLPVYVGGFAAIPLIPSQYATMPKALLICGILSSLLYVAMNVIVPMQWPAYNCASQTISELSAVNAPTSPIWVWLGILYTLLVTAFAWGVWKSAGQNHALCTAGKLLVAYGALGVFWPFAPMHLRETLAAGGSTVSDTMHITLGVVTEILYLAALGFTAAAFGKRFRLYSIATFVILLIFGILTFLDAPGISTNQPTPFIGVWERINIGIFLLWVVVLAIILLRSEKSRTQLTAAIPNEEGKERI